MPFIWLALVVSWALVRAAEETWKFSKVASAPVRTKLDRTVKARTKRKDWMPGKAKTRKAKGRGSWWAWAGFTALWLTGKTARYGWGATRATARGIRTGVAEGHRRYAEGQAARASARWDWDAWEDYLDAQAEVPIQGDIELIDPPDVVDGDVVEDEPATPDEDDVEAAQAQEVTFVPAPSPARDDEPHRPTVTAGPIGEPLMTMATTGEAPNLAAARAVAANIESTLMDAMGTVEYLLASLSAAGVGGDTKARFHCVMDTLSTSVTQARAAAQGMEDDQAQIEEAILAKPDAVAASTDFYRGG